MEIADDSRVQESAEATRKFFGGGRGDEERYASLSPRAGLLLALPILLLSGLLLGYPTDTLVSAAFRPGGLHNISTYFGNPLNTVVLKTTFRDSAIATAITIALGTLLAWRLRTATRRIVRLACLSAIFVPFWMGSVIKIYALSLILERTGIINRSLEWLGVTSGPIHMLYTEYAVVVGLVYQLLPFAALPLYVAFLGIDLTLIRAAEGLGASRRRAMWNIVLPLSLPGILASLTIVFILAIGFYLTPVLLGGGTSPFTASLIASYLYSIYDPQDAALSSLALLSGGALVLVAGYLVVGRERLRRAIA
jgi:ABC-type spermidine/putrescine transport system permease subunit I